MWTITCLSPGDTNSDTYCLLSEKKQYSVGRSNVDINLKNDSSISRIHAILYPSDVDVKILDNNSKYGIFLNENIESRCCIEKNKQYELRSNDRIKFGILENEWILKKIEINTLISTLNMEQKKILDKIVKLLHGTIAEKLSVDQNSIYSHLTMEKITVTTKLLYALAAKLPIVNCRYWKDVLIAAKSNEKLPKSEDYLPIIIEEFITIRKELLLSNIDRKDLFKDKILYFTSNKHLSDYVPVVTKIGGRVVPLNVNVSKSMLLNPNAIVIHNKTLTASEAQTSQVMNDLGDFLRKNSLRLVPDFEIGLAVVYNSIDKYCNPKFNAMTTICKPSSNSPSSLVVIAEETPQLNVRETSEQLRDSIEIPESEMAKSNTKEKEKKVISVQEEILIDSDDDFQLLIETSDKQLMSEKHSKFSDTKKIGNSSTEERDKNISDDFEENLPSTSNCTKRKISKSPEAEPQHKRLHLDHSEPISTGANFTGFLSKSLLSQRISANPELIANNSEMASQSNETQKQKKRGRFATLDSDDENDDNLFNFGGAAKKSKSQLQTNKENTSALFGFCKEKPKKQNNNGTSVSATSTTTSAAVTSKAEKSINSQTSRVNYAPIDLSSVSWLSKTFIKLEVTKIEEEENQKKLDETQMKYIQSIKNGFEVQIRPMNLVSRSFSYTNNNLSKSSGSSSGSGKNFKSFVKKQNFRTQKEVIGTVPVNISGFEF